MNVPAPAQVVPADAKTPSKLEWSPDGGAPAVPLSVLTFFHCCPNLIVFILLTTFATTMCDLVGCLGVLLGLL